MNNEKWTSTYERDFFTEWKLFVLQTISHIFKRIGGKTTALQLIQVVENDQIEADSIVHKLP